MFNIVKIKENAFRTVFNVEADSGHYQAFVYDFDEVRINKFDDEGLLDGEAAFNWKKEGLNETTNEFYTVLRLVIENNFG